MMRGPIESLFSRLRELQNYHTRFRVISGLILTAGVLFSGLILASLLSPLWTASVPFRVFFLGLFGLTFVCAVSYFIIRPILYPAGLEKLALKVEEHYPKLSDRLISALQLQRQYSVNPEGYSLDMIDAVIHQAEKHSAGLDYRSAVDNQNLRKLGKISGMLAVVLLAFLILLPGNFKSAFYAFSHPLTEIETPSKFTFEVMPGDAEVLKYSNLDVKIKLTPKPEFAGLELPRDLRLFYKYENGEWESVNLKKINPVNRITPEQVNFDYLHGFTELKRDFQYYAQAGGEESQIHAVTVVDKPRVVGLNVSLDFPDYTGAKSQVLPENEGDIKALHGTKANLRIETSKEIAKAELIFSNRDKMPLKLDGKNARGEFTVTSDKKYRIEITDQSGNVNPDPIEYQITALPDQNPIVDITYPGDDRDLDESMRLPLRIAVSDDFGASRLVIQYQIHSSENTSAAQEFEVGFPAGKSEFVAEKEWSLANFPLLPGNYISYKAVVWDNDRISGPKQGESRSYTLRLPTLDEIIAEVAREQSGQISEFEKVFTGMGELKQTLEKMTSNLEGQKGSNWEKGQELESALEQQNQILNKVEEIKAGLEKSWDKLTKNELVREEVAAKMQQIQNLMQEITTPEMKELMKKIQQAIKELDWEKIKKDMGDFKMSQEDLLKRLDQTLALLKRLQAEQKLDSMAQMLKKMTENQNQINQNINDASQSELSQLSQPEKMLGKDLESVGEQLKELEKLMEEVPALSQDEMSDLEQALNQAENQNDISKMSNQLMQSQGNEAGKTGEKLASSFQDASQKFAEMAEKLSSDEQEKFIAQMQNSLQDLLFLSGQQENLTDQTRQSVQQNQALRDLAAGQISLEEATQKVASDLEKLARETPAVPRKLAQTLGMCANQMSQAALQLSNKNSTNAAYYQTDAMANLNSAAQQLLETLNQSCNNPQSGMCQNPSLAQGLESLARQQQGINNATDQFSNMLQELMQPGEGLNDLARQQATVQKSLEELMSEYSSSVNALGRLDRLTEEIKQAARQLAHGDLGDELKQRQHKILNRLLDAQKSLYTQDYSNQRQAEEGQDIFRRSPLSTDDREKTERELLLEKIEREKYPPQYEEIIKSYLKAIREKDLK